MSVFPIVAEHTHLRHKGGTKDYFATIFNHGDLTASGRSLVMYRWGKKDAPGQTKYIRFESLDEARREVEKKLRDKERNGYMPIDTAAPTFHDKQAMTEIMPSSTLRFFPDSHLNWLSGTIPDDVPQDNETAAENRARLAREAEARARLEAAQREAEQAEMRKIQETNPLWGRF